VPDRWSLRAYTSLLTRSWKWPFEYGYCVIKFCKMSCIRWIFRGFDHHIVPSEFMTSVVEHVAGISREKIVVFPHTHHT
jgi:hypothetical protein